MKLKRSFKEILHFVCNGLELIAAILMIIGIVLAIFGTVTDIGLFKGVARHEHAFMEYIERVFAIVIGIEFLEMLYTPTGDQVIHTLIFLVARHMIVGEATPLENLISIVSIALLMILRHWLNTSGDGKAAGAPLASVRRALSGRRRRESDRPEEE